MLIEHVTKLVVICRTDQGAKRHAYRPMPAVPRLRFAHPTNYWTHPGRPGGALPRRERQLSKLPVVRSNIERLLDQPVDIPDGHLRAIGAFPLRLREVHENDLHVGRVLDVVGDGVLEVELDRSALIINQAEKVAFDAAELV